MQKSIILMSLLGLAACTPAVDKGFTSDPQHFGVFVATSNIQVNTNILLKDATGNQVKIQIVHYGHDDTGYINAPLAPGRYTLVGYSPDGENAVSIATPDGYFDVQADCFNYGGHYDFGVDQDGKPSYENTTTLKDIESLPKDLRRLASGRDVCAAPMGGENQRLAAADAASQLDL